MPKVFVEWVNDNKSRWQANGKAAPFFIRDNYQQGNVDKGLDTRITAAIEEAKLAAATVKAKAKPTTPDAQRRLRAIEEFSNIGSGFNIAMRDLDIRGAGNILGAEQSGFISEIGYDMYHKILNEAIEELKTTEFRDLYADEISQNSDYVPECQIQTDLEVLIPDEYVSNIRERVALYKELNDLVSDEELEAYKQRLTDRFGPLPKPTVELVETIKLRRMAKEMGVEKLILRNGKMTCNFVSDPKSPFYQSKTFGTVIDFVQRNQRTCFLKESAEKLTLTVDPIKTISQAILCMKRLCGIAE